MMFVRVSGIVLLWFLIAIGSAAASTKDGCIPGTYLIVEGGGAQSLWTFTKGGTVQSASSAQGSLHFSDGQGAWRHKRSHVAKVTFLDFTYGASVSPSNIARVDAELIFSKKCSTVEGAFSLRFFDPGNEDPLDIESDTGDPVTDTITGRKVVVSK